MRLIVFCTALFLCLLFPGCSSRLIKYKNETYFKNKRHDKNLLLMPIEFALHDSIKLIMDIYLKQNSGQKRDSSISYFNQKLSDYPKKRLRKRYVNIIDTISYLQKKLSAIPKNKQIIYYDKKKKKSVKTMIFDKSQLDFLKMDIDYVLYFTDLLLYLTIYENSFVLPLPVGFVSSSYSGPAYGMKGNYILWDQKESVIISAGQIDEVFTNCDLGNKQDRIKAERIIRKALINTPFWIREKDSNDLMF